MCLDKYLLKDESEAILKICNLAKNAGTTVNRSI